MVHIHTIRSQALLLPGVLHWWPSRAGLGQDAARDPAGHQGGNPPSSPALSLVRAPIAVLLTQQCPLSCLNNQPAFRPRTTCITLLSSAPPQSLAQISLKIHWINTWTNTDSPHFHDSLPQSLPPLEPETKLYGNALQTLLYIGVTWFENTDYTNGYCVKLQNRLIRLRKDFFFFSLPKGKENVLPEGVTGFHGAVFSELWGRTLHGCCLLCFNSWAGWWSGKGLLCTPLLPRDRLCVRQGIGRAVLSSHTTTKSCYTVAQWDSHFPMIHTKEGSRSDCSQNNWGLPTVTATSHKQ